VQVQHLGITISPLRLDSWPRQGREFAESPESIVTVVARISLGGCFAASWVAALFHSLSTSWLFALLMSIVQVWLLCCTSHKLPPNVALFCWTCGWG
jgi:hypothetical protein